MKKVFNFLRSMRFGLLLLGLIGLCSVIGTVIPQGREVAWYAQNYPASHGYILLLRLHRIFESWYFIALLALLCLNLSLCSLLFCNGTLALCYLGGFQGSMLSFKGVLSLLFSIATHLLGNLGLLLGCITLFLADATFLQRYLLHLGVDALHNG